MSLTKIILYLNNKILLYDQVKMIKNHLREYFFYVLFILELNVLILKYLLN